MKRVYYLYLSIPLVGDLNHPQLAAPIAIVTVVLIAIITTAIIIVLMWHKKRYVLQSNSDSNGYK